MKFLEPLELEYLDGEFFKVTAPFDYAVGAPDSPIVVHVPVGFLTDFASIPRVLWNILPPTSWYGKAAVIHDFLYQHGQVDAFTITQRYADDVLNEAMGVLAAAALEVHDSIAGEFRLWADREAIYEGVRIGGFVTWDKYRRQQAAGKLAR